MVPRNEADEGRVRTQLYQTHLPNLAAMPLQTFASRAIWCANKARLWSSLLYRDGTFRKQSSVFDNQVARPFANVLVDVLFCIVQVFCNKPLALWGCNLPLPRTRGPSPGSPGCGWQFFIDTTSSIG